MENKYSIRLVNGDIIFTDDAGLKVLVGAGKNDDIIIRIWEQRIAHVGWQLIEVGDILINKEKVLYHQVKSEVV
jgi:hypothetical protein